MIDETVQLGLAKCFQFKGNIEPQLGQQLEAGVGDELRGIEGAAEQAPAIAAELRYQQRGEGVLPVDAARIENRSNSGCIRDTVSSILVKSTRPLKREARSLPFWVLPRPSMPWLNTKLNWLMPPEGSAESASTRRRKPRSRSSVLGGVPGRSKKMPRSSVPNVRPAMLRLRSRARMIG